MNPLIDERPLGVLVTKTGSHLLFWGWSVTAQVSALPGSCKDYLPSNEVGSSGRSRSDSRTRKTRSLLTITVSLRLVYEAAGKSAL